MKKLLVVISVVAAGCGPSAEEKAWKQQAENGTSFIVDDGLVPIVVLDSCEYLKSPSAYGYYSLTHKGNCKFCKLRK